MLFRSVVVSSGHSGENLQRQKDGADGASPKDPCEQLENDRESFSIMVVRHLVRTRMDPLFDESAKSVICRTPQFCELVYPSGLTASVVLNPTLNRVAVGARRGNELKSCALEYSCDQNGQLTFKILQCDGQKPSP